MVADEVLSGQSCSVVTLFFLIFPLTVVALLLFFADTGFGTIYTSDDQGIIYSKSLEKHLYTATGAETDFTNVTSLRGVYVTSVLSQGECHSAWIQYQGALLRGSMETNSLA